MTDDGIGGTDYSIEDLSDYLDRGREPRIAEIEANAECRAVLASLERMADLSRELVDAESTTELNEGWFDGIMRHVAREVRAGRDIPLEPVDDETTLVITEGAVRSLMREVGDAVPGVIVERTRLVGDVADASADVRIEISMSVAFGHPIPRAVEDVRSAIREAARRHTGLRIAAIDVTVDSMHGAEQTGGRR